MDITSAISEFKATHVARSYNYSDTCEVSSVHWFNAEGKEVFYIVPTIYGLTQSATECYRDNPIDYPNAYPM